MKQIDGMNGRQVARQPGKQQIEAVVVGRKAQSESPDSSLPQQISKRRALGRARAILRLCSAASDVLALGARKEFVFAWTTIESVEKREKENADQAGRGKIPTPSKTQQHETQHRYSDG